MSSRAVRTGFAFALLGGAFALGWAAAGAGWASPAIPRSTFAAVAAWGAVAGGAVGVLAGGSTSRTTVPLGFGALLGAVGAVGGIAVGAYLFGHDLPDVDDGMLMASAFVGAGIGWTVGAVAGLTTVRDAAALAPSQVRIARAVAVGIALAGVMIAGALGPGIDLATHPRDSTAVMRATALGDAFLVAATLVIVAGTRPRREQEVPLDSRAVGMGGLVVGCLVLVALLASIPGSWVSADTRRLATANAWTAQSLAQAGTAYAERRGTIPESLRVMKRAGGEVMPGTHVNGVWLMTRGFCVEVGTSMGADIAVSPQSEAVWFAETNSGELRAKVSAGGIGGCETMIAEGP